MIAWSGSGVTSERWLNQSLNCQSDRGRIYWHTFHLQVRCRLGGIFMVQLVCSNSLHSKSMYKNTFALFYSSCWFLYFIYDNIKLVSKFRKKLAIEQATLFKPWTWDCLWHMVETTDKKIETPSNQFPIVNQLMHFCSESLNQMLGLPPFCKNLLPGVGSSYVMQV